MTTDDKREDEDDEQAECDLCTYEFPIGGLREVGVCSADGKYWLCEICRGSFLNAAMEPGFEKSRPVEFALFASIGWIGNRLREDIADAMGRAGDEEEADGAG